MMHRLWVRFRFWLMAWGLLRQGAFLVHLEPGDVLVLSVEERLSMDQVERIRAYFSGRLTGVDVAVMDAGMRVSGVLRMHAAHGDGHATMPDPRERADDLRRIIKNSYWGGISAWLDRYLPETDK